jgi:predicted phosphoribosyltransferase
MAVSFGRKEEKGLMARQTAYADRAEAGRLLAEDLLEYADDHPVVVGLPRGGVVVAAEIAGRLKAELDVIIAGKLRAPFNPELAIGAVTEDGVAYINRASKIGLRIKDAYMEEEKRERLKAVKERLRLYRGVKKKVPLAGRTVIIADDGLATGSTMISAIQAAKASGAGRIIVAVPGGPPDTVERIGAMEEVERLVAPLVPEYFYAVSQLYLDFSQVEDDTVMEILRGFAGGPGWPAGEPD